MTISIDSSVLTRLFAVDPDRVRAAKLAEPERRAQLLTLYAFHMELAKVPELVTEPMIGQIRYQWWRDCLDEIYAGATVRAHDIARPLKALIDETGISRFLLDRMIDGRERDLDPRPFASMEEALEYVDATSGAVLAAAMAICEQDTAPNLGRAWGLTGLARSYRYYSGSMLQSVEFSEILRAAQSAFDEADRAMQSAALPAAAYVSLVPGFLKRMGAAGYDPRADVPGYAPLLKQFRLLRSVAVGRI